MSSSNESTGLPAGYPFRPEWEVDPFDLARRRDNKEEDKELVLLDCRTAQEVAIAKIGGSIHIPMDQIAVRIEELEVNIDKEIVVYCHHGQRSLRVTNFLRSRGFDNTKSLAGGIDLWAQVIDPGVPRY